MEDKFIARVLNKGQIVIPKAIRQQTGITPGHRVELKVVGGKIIISEFREKYTEKAKGVIKGRLSLKDLEELYEPQ